MNSCGFSFFSLQKNQIEGFELSICCKVGALCKVKQAEKNTRLLFASSKKPNPHDFTILADKQPTVSKKWLRKNEFCKMLKSESITSLSLQKSFQHF